MKVVALVSQKGGVGKTTLAGHLSVQACQNSQEVISVIDTDPQGSLSAWWNARNAETPLFSRVPLESLDTHIKELEKQGVTLLFIDTPPAITDSIRKVISVSDLIVIPTRPSPHDLRAVSATIELVVAEKKPMVFVINGASVRARITAEAAIALSQYGRVCPITIHNRVDFASSMTDGRTVLEMSSTSRSAEEIKDLWTYLLKLVN